jgi:hypothetical protein
LGFACAAAFAQPAAAPVPLETLKPEAATVSQIFDTSKLQPVLKGATKVAVTMFSVESVQKTGKGVRMQSADGGSVSQSVTYLLAGVPQEQMQAVLDRAYDDFVAELKSIGLEVVPVADVLATQAHRKLAPTAAGGPKRVEQGEGVIEIYNARGLATVSSSRWIYMNTIAGGGSSAGGQIGGLLSLARTAGNIGSMVGDGAASSEIASELGVAAIAVQLPLEFVEQAASGSRSGSVTSAEVASRLRLSLSPMGYLGVTHQGQSVALPLRMPLVMAGTPVAEVKDTSSVATNVGLAVLSMALGSKSSTRLTEKTAVADRERFAPAVGDGLAQLRPILKQALIAMQ